MRVAVLSRDAHSHPGGDLVLIAEESKALAEIGVERVYNPEDLSGFDLVHCYHLNFLFARDALLRAKASGLSIVLTAAWFDLEDQGVSFKEQGALLRIPRRVISWTRVAEVMLRLRTGFRGAVDIIPMGVGEQFFASAFGRQERSGVLSVNARDPHDQGAGLVAVACQELEIPWSCALGTPHAEMPKVYQGAKVFVFARENAWGCHSYGMTTMEALASGCRVLATVAGLGIAAIPGIQPIDPGDSAGLREAIRAAYFDEPWNWAPNAWAREHSWGVVAAELKRCYEETLR